MDELINLCKDIEKAEIWINKPSRTEKEIEDFMPKVTERLKRIRELTLYYSQYYLIDFKNLTYVERIDEQMKF